MLLPWAEFKGIAELLNAKVYHHLVDSSPNKYYATFGNPVMTARCQITVTADVTAFEAWALKGDLKDSERISNAWAKASEVPPCNIDNAPIYELGDSLGLPGESNLTILSHDFSSPETWYQNSTKVTQEVLTGPTAGLYPSANAIWVNTQHPAFMVDEIWDGVDPANPKYVSLFDKVGGQFYNDKFWPVIEVDPLGDGNWVTADPEDASATPTANYKYRIDYIAGKVKFLQIGDWDAACKVRATYYYVVETETGSSFEVGPSAGYIWRLIYTEGQTSVGSQWNDTLKLYSLRNGFPAQRSPYRTFLNMHGTGTTPAWEVDGSTAAPAPWPSCAENGWPWPENLYDGKRNLTQKLATIPWKYLLAKPLDGDLGDTLRVGFLNGSKITATDGAFFTFYIKTVKK